MNAVKQPRDAKGRFVKEPRWVNDIKFTETRKVKQDLLMWKLSIWSVVTALLVFAAGYLGVHGTF